MLFGAPNLFDRSPMRHGLRALFNYERQLASQTHTDDFYQGGGDTDGFDESGSLTRRDPRPLHSNDSGNGNQAISIVES